MRFICSYIIPLLISLTIATTQTGAKPKEEGNEISRLPPPSLVIRKPLVNIDASILKIVGDSILTTLVSKVVATASSEPTKLAQLGAAPAITPTSVITDSSQALMPIELVERGARSPEDKLAGISCDTKRAGYEKLAAFRPIKKGYEYLWKVGSYWASDPGDHDRVSCSWTSGIFIINETPESKVIAFARVADLARDIRIKCGDSKNNTVNGEVTDVSGLIIVVSWADC